jgi:hypothetical protein
MNKTKVTLMLTAMLVLLMSGISHAQTKATGQWEITDSVDEMTSKKSTLVILKSEDSKYALILYQKSKADNFIVGFSLLDRGLIVDNKKPLLRFDEETAFEQYWTRFQQGKSAVFMVNSDKLLSGLLAATTFRIRFEEYLGGLTTVKFDMRGLKATLESLKTRD